MAKRRIKSDGKKLLGFFIILAIGLLTAIILVNLFLDLREEMGEKDLAPFDDHIAEKMKSTRSDGLTEFFTGITFFGDLKFYLIAMALMTAVIYKVYGNFETTIKSAIILAFAGVMQIVLKDFIERPRPTGEHLVEVSSTSFPSGHAVSSAAFFGFLIYIFWKSDVNYWIKTLLTVVFSFFILSIGLSRVYLGVHYASDIIGGWIAGGFFLVIFILAFYAVKFIKNNNH